MGAGCIIMRDDKILVLQRKDGRYDLPKGHQEPTETLFECAQRETFEECGLWFEFGEVQGLIEHEELSLYVVNYTKGKVVLKPNPETNELEHVGYKWISPFVFVLQCLPYMIPHIRKYIGVKYASH